MKEGDVFRWYYKNDLEYRKSSPSTTYWCMDNQAVVVDGKLVDTYWMYIGEDKTVVSSSCTILDINKVNLEFKCNINEIEWIREYEIENYDTVYNLSYQKNSYKRFAVDRGVGESLTALLSKSKKLLSEAQSNLRCAMYDVERYTKEISELEEKLNETNR